MESQATTSYRQAFATFPESGMRSADWLLNVRRKSYERFQTIGFPTRKLESWKYINLEPILETTFFPPQAATPAHVDRATITPYLIADRNGHLLTLVNGTFAPKLSQLAKLPAGVILENLAAAMTTHPHLVQPYLAPQVENETNAFAAVNAFTFEDGCFLSIPEATIIEEPIQLLIVAGESTVTPVTFSPRIVVHVGRGSKAHLAITLAGTTQERYFMNTVLNATIGEGATLNCTLVQHAPPSAIHFVTSTFAQDKGSKLSVVGTLQGGAVTRTEAHVLLRGEEADCQLRGLSLITGDAEMYHHTLVEHIAPRCKSRQLYKHILNQNARSEFDSLSMIHKGAILTDSYQLNRNIVLSKTARAITRPQLKVFSDDVKASHGATVGQLDEHELFYLQSRGLNKELARSILMHGFAEEVVQDVEHPEIKKRLDQFVNEELAHVVRD